MTMELLGWTTVCLLIILQLSVPADCQSEVVKCFTNYNSDNDKCENPLGNLELDDCCMNINYAYAGPDGNCLSCGLPTWTEWSPWGSCSESCKTGVTLRRRRCIGMGICTTDKLGTVQMKACSIDCCPELSTWAEWGPWQACSVTCGGGGRRVRQRTCLNIAGACGTKCEGSSEEADTCSVSAPCPVHGGWASWEPWLPCSSTCVVEGGTLPTRQRQRTCTNPSPSTTTTPPGRDCPGENRDTDTCVGLPYCPVDGAWGAWGPWGASSVSCGVGVQVQHRSCDNPAQKHRGRTCPGSNAQSRTWNTRTHCPVNGRWEEWSEWSECNPTDKRDIKCIQRAGLQSRQRDCPFTAHNGLHCEGEISETRPCFNIHKCPLDGTLGEWGEWSFCDTPCRSTSYRRREKICEPDLSKYPKTAGRKKEKASFYGKPLIDCKVDFANRYAKEKCNTEKLVCPLEETNP